MVDEMRVATGKDLDAGCSWFLLVFDLTDVTTGWLWRGKLDELDQFQILLLPPKRKEGVAQLITQTVPLHQWDSNKVEPKCERPSL